MMFHVNMSCCGLAAMSLLVYNDMVPANLVISAILHQEDMFGNNGSLDLILRENFQFKYH